MSSAVFTTTGEAETRRLAATLGRVCRGGEVVGLVGDLGAGKTCFVQGLAIGLGIPASERVTSPTFALVASHAGRVTLHHVDLYRLGDPDEVATIGYDDLFDREAVVAVEWFERFPELWPRGYLRVELRDVVPAALEPPDGASRPMPTAGDGQEGASPWIQDGQAEERALDAPRRVTATARGVQHAETLARWAHAASQAAPGRTGAGRAS